MKIGENPTWQYGKFIGLWPEGLYRYTSTKQKGYQAWIIRTGPHTLYKNTAAYPNWNLHNAFVTVTENWEKVGDL